MLSAPLITLILAWLYLGEVASRSELLYLSLTLVGAAMVIFYPSEDDEKVTRVAQLGSASFIAYLILIAEPLSRAVAQVLTRRLRNIGPQTTTTYTNIIQIPVLLLCSRYTGVDLGVWR